MLGGDSGVSVWSLRLVYTDSYGTWVKNFKFLVVEILASYLVVVKKMTP